MHPLRRIVRRSVLLVLLLLAGVVASRAADPPPLDLEVDISQCTAKSVFTVYFDVGDGIESLDSIAQPVSVTAGPDVQRLYFGLPEGSVRQLRLDPLATAGTVVIDALKLRTIEGRVLGQLDLHGLGGGNDVADAVFQPGTGSVAISTLPGATNPQCFLKLDPPITVGPRTFRNVFPIIVPNLVSYGAWLDLAAILWLGGLALLTRRWLRARWPAWPAWQVNSPASTRPFRLLRAWIVVPLVLYAWLMLLNLGHTPMLPDSESSWAAVLTYAVVHHWQFGRQILLTFGPAVPLIIGSYSHAIDGKVIVCQMLCKAWFLVLMIWLGSRLPPVRRLGFWAVALVVFAGVSTPAMFSFSVMAIGLLFARGDRAERRWLLAPTIVYLATVALIKVSFTLSAVLMLGAVGVDRGWRRQWREALAPAAGFVVCYVVEWLLLRQHFTNLPIYLRGSFEMVSGFSQAMSIPPDPGVLILALCMVLAAAAQLGLLFLPDRRPRWLDLPMLGLLAAGLLLSWKASFVRADGHVLDWFAYALASACAAPAFVPMAPGVSRRWLEPACLGVILFAGILGIPRVEPVLGSAVRPLLTERWSFALSRLFHPDEAADAERQSIERSRAKCALPQIKAFVGDHPVDMLCDEQAVALLNGLNFRPRPSFVSYSTYTPWLANLDVAYYCSPQAPDFVLFKLVSIDLRLPALQSGPLLVLLAEYYRPVLTEGGYVLFQKREPPRAAGAPASFPLLREGDLTVGEELPLPLDGTVWCQLDFRATFRGRLLGMFYQQPAVWMRVETDRYFYKSRIVPAMTASGFLLNPMVLTDDDFTGWLQGQPLAHVVSLRIADSSAVAGAFQPRVHYKLYRVPFSPPPAAPVPATPAAGTTPAP